METTKEFNRETAAIVFDRLAERIRGGHLDCGMRVEWRGVDASRVSIDYDMTPAVGDDDGK